MNNFQKAWEMSLNDWLATIPEEIPEAEYTDKHEKWKRKLFNKMRGDRYHRFTTKTVKVMLIAATLTALLLTAFVIPSSREYIIDNFDIFSRYQITEPNDNSVNGEITVGYIPKGFELVEKQLTTKTVIYNYKNNQNSYVSIMQSSSTVNIEFDTEKGNFEEIVFNSNLYIYFLDGKNFGYLVWNKNDYVYQIHGSISKDEMIKIAETVK